MTDFDLSMKMAPYLDKHMVFPLLEFHHQLGIYPEDQIDECRLQLLEGSKMADFRMEIFQRLYPDKEIPEEMVSKRLEVVEQWNSMKKQMEPIVEILEKEEVKKQMQISRDSNQLMEFLVENFGFRVELLDVLYKFAKLYYEVGGYEETTLHLYLHNLLVPPSDPNYISSLWGKLASEILLKNWEAAVEDMNRLKEYIDSNVFTVDAMALTQRCWLIHWSLFVFFNMPKGYELLIDMFLYQTNYLNTIQTMCPHVLRYLTTAVVITHQTRPQALKDLVKVIQQEAYSYRDPITEFIECLYVNFDFDGAQQKLKACQSVLANDFFTVACPSDFIENARLMTFETFCRIHQVISIDMLAQKLNMERGKAERWIADLIRHAQLDAKIDSAQGHVLMGTLAVSPYQQLIEKTKNLSFRSQMLTQTIEKKINARMYEHSSWGVDV